MPQVVFRLPDLGEGLTDAEIVEWHAAVGDRVDRDQPLVSVETDKAVVEVPDFGVVEVGNPAADASRRDGACHSRSATAATPGCG